MADPVHASTVQHEPAGGEAKAFGLDAPVFIALAMIVVLAIMIWKKVPAAIGKALDAKIALIRDQLAEAEALRKEAEALKAEYQAKANAAGAEAAAMIERAHGEAREIVAKAKTDAEALIARRSRMAEDKIAAEERAAVKELRAAAVDGAARAAARLIAGRDDPATDQQLVDRTIAELPSR
ncbi:MAG: F0F1 ATP synthase subunit B [Sphingomicrobium sp.]